jgi:hypothetical protein
MAPGRTLAGSPRGRLQTARTCCSNWSTAAGLDRHVPGVVRAGRDLVDPQLAPRVRNSSTQARPTIPRPLDHPERERLRATGGVGARRGPAAALRSSTCRAWWFSATGKARTSPCGERATPTLSSSRQVDERLEDAGLAARPSRARPRARGPRRARRPAPCRRSRSRRSSPRPGGRRGRRGVQRGNRARHRRRRAADGVTLGRDGTPGRQRHPEGRPGRASRARGAGWRRRPRTRGAAGRGSRSPGAAPPAGSRTRR